MAKTVRGTGGLAVAAGARIGTDCVIWVGVTLEAPAVGQSFYIWHICELRVTS